MKFRKSFVTNSSSSSYICDFCGYVASGWDMSLSEAAMFSCVNGHTFCEEHVLKNNEWLKKFKEYLKQKIKDEQIQMKERPNAYGFYSSDDINFISDEKLEEANCEDLIAFAENLDLNFRYDLPKELCLFCNLEDITDSTVAKLVLKDNNIDKAQLVAIIKTRFGDYDHLEQYLKNE